MPPSGPDSIAGSTPIRIPCGITPSDFMTEENYVGEYCRALQDLSAEPLFILKGLVLMPQT